MGNFYYEGINNWIVYNNPDVNLAYPQMSIPSDRFVVENYEVFQVTKNSL
jgi:hypothetical protein